VRPRTATLLKGRLPKSRERGISVTQLERETGISDSRVARWRSHLKPDHIEAWREQIIAVAKRKAALAPRKIFATSIGWVIWPERAGRKSPLLTAASQLSKVGVVILKVLMAMHLRIQQRQRSSVTSSARSGAVSRGCDLPPRCHSPPVAP
jgi:hypothetical protein